MSILTGWVTNIIIFILFAVVLEMLLPNTAMQKYTKLVIGLLLIAIFITPLLSIFRDDFAEEIQKKLLENDHGKNSQIESSMESKKREIEETQHAYILEHMAVQLKKEAEKEMMDKHQYAINQIVIELNDKKGEVKTENIKNIFVTVAESTKKTSSKDVQPVEKINIDLGENKLETKAPSPQIVETLAKIWGLDEKKIIINFKEGGEGI